MAKSYRAQQRQRLMASAWVDREHRNKWEYIEKRLGRAMTPDELKDYIGYIDSKGKFRAPRKNWYAVPPGTEMRPVFQHDCDACEFITNLTTNDAVEVRAEYDVYRCNAPTGPTWIARYGNDGPDYWSMPWEILKAVDPKGDVTPLLRRMQQVAKRWEEAA